MTSKILKLISHQKNYREEDLIVNIKDLGCDVHAGDVVEIYHPEDDLPRLLLQIPVAKDDITQQKDTISIEHSICQSFQLRTYKDVIVNKVNMNDSALELIDLTFKDQYLGRSEMWRLKKYLEKSVVYLNKKIEFCGGSIRCQVYEMWSHGEKVACGVVTEDTKIVYRSSTSMVYLFIQMSSEMWEFDIYGDLYFEKAINGFMAEMFTKWKNEGSNHEVTIVLFSRTYYKASSIDEFPSYMRQCLQQDYMGRIYEDFYRVAVQSERYDDWTPILTLLRQLFSDYLPSVLYHHQKENFAVPEARNSCASQGNFLEVLNISQNVFEKHYLDRSFDRTGQVSVVITPGVGVFEVDRVLTNITKQRIIDNGVGSDLVCVGEQPLHAVPLLKFHNKKGSVNADDYSMPHTWINLSFYSTNKKVGYGSFVPRIKLPPEKPSRERKDKVEIATKPSIKSPREGTTLPNSVFDYDAFDAKVFKLPNISMPKSCRSLQTGTPDKKLSSPNSSVQVPVRLTMQRKMSDPDLYCGNNQFFTSSLSLNSSTSLSKSPAINIPIARVKEVILSHSFGALNVETTTSHRPLTQTLYENDEFRVVEPKIGMSADSSPLDRHPHMSSLNIVRPSKSLINPFDPSHVTIKLTSNRRRWINIFPTGPSGFLIQQHHYLALSNSSVSISQLNSQVEKTQKGSRTLSLRPDLEKANNSPSQMILRTQRTSVPSVCKEKQHETLLWGATGEQEWTAALTTGVDWKSLSLPACLPITTDYFPEERSLHNDYVVSDYNLLPEDALETNKSDKMVTTSSVFHELISQRLAQGFQLIVKPENLRRRSEAQLPVVGGVSSGSSWLKGIVASSRFRNKDSKTSQEYCLSIGRIFHRIHLDGSTITVTIYRPRHPYPQLQQDYRYRFLAPDMISYKVACVKFSTEKLETYLWNHLDNYICFRGSSEYPLNESLKYWRIRILIVPEVFRNVTKSIYESPNGSACDLYGCLMIEELQLTIEGFLRFMELTINRLRRQANHRKGRQKTTVGIIYGNPRRRRSIGFVSSCANSGQNVAVLRERLGSNRVVERPRAKSGGKTSDKLRFESGNREVDEVKVLGEAVEDDGCEDGVKLTLTSPHAEVVRQMCDANKGVVFIKAVVPATTFIAADATCWICQHVDGINTEVEAVMYLQKLLELEFICHISGNRKQKFVHGFYLYCFVTGKGNDEVAFDCLVTDWHEVEVEAFNVRHGTSHATQSSLISQSLPSFLLPDLSSLEPCQSQGSYGSGKNIKNEKESLLELDLNNKSERCEWGHLSYQSYFSPSSSYQLIIKWLCATGTIVSDLVSTWQRKAQSNGLYLFPVPSDTFADCNTYNSEPLRGTILIPLNVASLGGIDGHIFAHFPKDSWKKRMLLLQESILYRFGFMQYSKVHYVHVTGNMFVTTNFNDNKKEPFVLSENSDLVEFDVGFLLSFNFMLTKHWRVSGISGDEGFAERIMNDFRLFCANDNNRLQDFWQSQVDQISCVDDLITEA